MEEFLAKINNSDNRDVVNYLDNSFDFECDHYFGGLHICGANFCGDFGLKDIVYNHFEDLTTILTQEEFIKLYELDDKIHELGYDIKKDDERYNKGLEYQKEFDVILQKLLTDDNKKLFEQVIEEEKEFLKQEYDLTDEEIEEIYENNITDYEDRGMVCTIFSDFDEMVEDEKFSLGYDKQPYFDDEAFGNDLLESGYYKELSTNRIVYYSC